MEKEATEAIEEEEEEEGENGWCGNPGNHNGGETDACIECQILRRNE